MSACRCLVHYTPEGTAQYIGSSPHTQHNKRVLRAKNASSAAAAFTRGIAEMLRL